MDGWHDRWTDGGKEAFCEGQGLDGLYCWLGLVLNERISTLHGISSSHFAMAPSIKERLVFFIFSTLI